MATLAYSYLFFLFLYYFIFELNYLLGNIALKLKTMITLSSVVYVTCGITIIVLTYLKKNETSKTDPLPWFCPFFETKIPISKVSNSDLKVMLTFTKPNSKAYIKTVVNRTRETMKHFC